MSDKGFTDKVKGKVKKAVGDATGDNSAYLCFLQKVYFLIVQEYSKRCVHSIFPPVSMFRIYREYPKDCVNL